MSGSMWSKAGAALIPLLLAAVFRLFMPLSAAAVDEEDCSLCHGLRGFSLNTGDETKELFVAPTAFETSTHSLLNCRECHSDIAAIPHPDALRKVSCGQTCHQQDLSGTFFSHESLFWKFTTSIHGDLSGEALTCMFCHPAESLANPGRRDLKREVLQCAACHRDNSHVRSYFKGLHYLALSLGDRRAPSCPDCHSAHGVLPSGSPDSSTHPKVLAQTCGFGAADSGPAGRCHGEVAPKSVLGARMTALALPGKEAHWIGWVLSGAYWALLAGLIIRVGLGAVRRR